VALQLRCVVNFFL